MYQNIKRFFTKPVKESKEESMYFLKRSFLFLLLFNLADTVFTKFLYLLDPDNFQELNPIVNWMIHNVLYWEVVLGLAKLILLTITFFYFKSLIKINKFTSYIKFGVHVVFWMQLFWVVFMLLQILVMVI